MWVEPGNRGGCGWSLGTEEDVGGAWELREEGVGVGSL